jgi:hypothetical protein
MTRIEITDDEALILFDYLQHFSDTGSTDFRDQAEKRVLWNLCAVLEKSLAPFPHDYRAAVRHAQDRLRDQS